MSEVIVPVTSGQKEQKNMFFGICLIVKLKWLYFKSYVHIFCYILSWLCKGELANMCRK